MARDINVGDKVLVRWTLAEEFKRKATVTKVVNDGAGRMIYMISVKDEDGLTQNAWFPSDFVKKYEPWKDCEKKHMPDSWLNGLPPMTGPNGKPWKPRVLRMGGWSKIVRELVDDLFALGWNGSLFQIKEKFGGLRFYIGHGTHTIFDRIEKAESESMKTCEVCGLPGKPRSDGWVRTLCDIHAKED